MIPPYGLEVTYDKTTHIIFPSAVRYVELGSPNLIAGKADGQEEDNDTGSATVGKDSTTTAMALPVDMGIVLHPADSKAMKHLLL